MTFRLYGGDVSYHIACEPYKFAGDFLFTRCDTLKSLSINNIAVGTPAIHGFASYLIKLDCLEFSLKNFYSY